MRIELRDDRRRQIGQVSVVAAERPTRVGLREHRPGVVERIVSLLRDRTRRAAHASANSGNPSSDKPAAEVFLNWDSAVDDAGQLRRCVVCGCGDLFREKAFPQVTGFVVVLAFAGAVIGALGLATRPPVLTAMAIVLVLDVAILVFSQRRLVCYRCRASYHDLPIARYHRPWDRSLADRHAPKEQAATPAAQGKPPSPDIPPRRSAMAAPGH